MAKAKRTTRGSETDPNSISRIRVLTGYAAHARFLVNVSEEPIGSVPRQIETPYAYAPTHLVWAWQGQPIVIAETAHRRYEVFRVDGHINPVEEN